MNELRKAAQMSLEALEYIRYGDQYRKPIDALRAALAQPIIPPEIKGDKAEPVGWLNKESGFLVRETTHPEDYVPVYRAPPQRKPLTDEEINKLWTQKLDDFCWIRLFARAIEKAHGIGGDV